MPRPNILFIATDHQRADSIGAIQAGVEVTPNLNHLAAQGTRFTRAYTTCPLCAPARTAIATGRYPTVNGVVCNDWKGETAGAYKPLHQYLEETGYDVAHVGVDHIRVLPTLRERVDFGLWVSNAEYARFMVNEGLDPDPEDPGHFKREISENRNGDRVRAFYSNTEPGVWPHSEEFFLDAFYGQQGIDFIHRDRDRPFALFVYLWAPHPPLRLPEPYATLFDPARIDLPANVGRPAEDEPPNRRQGIAAQLAEGISESEWRRTWAAHLGLTHLADAVVGRLLDALNSCGHEDDTLITFTTDHGDHLGQHSMYQKMELYEQAIRIPLIFRSPDIGTRTCDTPVSHLDLMPTLLEAAGIDLPAELDGISLNSYLTSGDSLPERSIFSQYSGNPTVGDIRRTVVTRRYKYIYDPTDIPELYDLEADPLESRNIAVEHPDIVTRMHAECRDWGETHGDWIDY